MISTLYKVIFKGFNDLDRDKLILTFRDIGAENSLPVPSYVLLDLKNVSENNKNILNFRNIDEVIIIGQKLMKRIYNYYYVILTIKNNKKEGFLIGNLKKEGDLLIGLWPFDEYSNITKELISEKFKKLINKYHEFSEICIIN